MQQDLKPQFNLQGTFMRFLSVACIFAFISPAFADDVKNPIKLPIVKVEPQPAIGALKLSSDVYYVVESDVPVMILSSPDGIVSIASETGPIKLRGKFIDGNGKVETRSYRSKFIYTVEPASSGAVELLIFAVGEPDAAKVKRVQLLVGDIKPIPPPKPIDPVDPIKPVVNSFRVIMALESGDTKMTAAQISILYGKEVEEYLNAKCTGGKAGWRRRDKDSAGDADPTMAALWSAVKQNLTTVPAFAVEVNGKVELIPLEATPALMVAKLKTYRGE